MIHQQGVALITALLIVALAATISAAITTAIQLDVRRTGNLISFDQARLYITPAEQLAMNVLNQDSEDNSIDHLEEDWNQVIPPIPVDGGQITGKITDLQACLNVNSLVPSISAALAGAAGAADAAGATPLSNQTQRERFERLLDLIGVRTQPTDAIIDWIDSDANTTIPNGAEDGHYLNLEKPYRTADTAITSLSTLRLIRGFERIEDYEAILPFVCAFGDSANINVNTAPEAVLLSLAEDMSKSDAEAIMNKRLQEPFEDLSKFLEINDLNKKIKDQTGLDVKSDYFLLRTNIEIGNARRTVYSIINRDGKGSSKIISRSQNTL